MARIIGIQHRVKKTSTGESRPTMVAISDGEHVRELELEDEQAELDFVFGKFPVGWREPIEGEDLSTLLPHHTKKRKKGMEEVVQIPAQYEGLCANDSVVMILGGSGDRLAFALSRQGEKVGAKIFRIPGFKLASHRREADKKKDHVELARIFVEKPELYYEVSPADRDKIRVAELHRARRDTQVDRIACEQRLRQRLIGTIFLSEEGGYPEGTVADEFDKLKANDTILATLTKEERQRETELRTAIQKVPIWQEFFAPMKGCGEVIAAGLISTIGDIRMFDSAAKLKAFCGVHVLTDGRFPRKRTGSSANWNPRARQALYLLGQQFVYRADSEWGKKLREYKVKFRTKYPEPVIGENGKKRYTDMHIHKMAIWRTLTKFVERLHKEWKRLDTGDAQKKTEAA
ncbi:transposase [Candidatus Parcubacteria bacterium]|nr:transposase [Candidatus Parcubacteria bacterium]